MKYQGGQNGQVNGPAQNGSMSDQEIHCTNCGVLASPAEIAARVCYNCGRSPLTDDEWFHFRDSFTQELKHWLFPLRR